MQSSGNSSRTDSRSGNAVPRHIVEQWTGKEDISFCHDRQPLSGAQFDDRSDE
jgi:hypothetical protein